MRQRSASKVAIVAAAAVCATFFTRTGPAGAGTHAAVGGRAATATGAWGTAEEVPGLAALNKGGYAAITSVSCASPGNCSAGGYYTGGTGKTQAFAVDETGGTWGTPKEIAAALNKGGDGEILSVSCASPGNCSAGGYYANGRNNRLAFAVDETGGTWGTPKEVAAALNKGGGAQISSVSCASAGNCGAGGYYAGPAGTQHAFVVSEANGTWGTAAKVTGTTMPDVRLISAVTSVSCPSAGNCSAGGEAPNYSAPSWDQAFVAGETNGVWGTAEEPPGVTAPNQAGINTLSCASAGNCSAGGIYETQSTPGPVNQAFVVDETDGTLGTAQEVAVAVNKGGDAAINSLSCASAGNCSAGGYYEGSRKTQAFVIAETDGTWGKVDRVPGTAALNTGRTAAVSSVSCRSAGNCSAGGTYTDSSHAIQVFVVDQTNGTWGTAEEVPGTAALNKSGRAAINSLSCASAGNCSAGGYYSDGSGKQQAFVVSSTATATGR
jgi:hypothetical protein